MGRWREAVESLGTEEEVRVSRISKSKFSDLSNDEQYVQDADLLANAVAFSIPSGKTLAESNELYS
jgi:hypothetical protein